MSTRTYTAGLLFVAGMGGFLYGYDIGIIGAALLYLNKTVALSPAQESAVVAAVLAGGTLSSLVAGALCDLLGRRRVMILAAGLFLASVVLIVSAAGFATLFAGRALQGLSAGMIAVAVPLYLAECLAPEIRGRGTALFQLLLTTGILVALAVGSLYTRRAEAVTGSAAAVLQAQDAAWRDMFLTALYPGMLFLLGAVWLAESPRWLRLRGRTEEARAALRRARPPAAAEAEFTLLQRTAAAAETAGGAADSLWRRRYLVPFGLACAVLGLTQTTGINSILQFIVVLLQKSGLSPTDAAMRGTWVTAVNVLFTVVGLVLVDRVGRKVLLQTGAAGVALALAAAGIAFWRIEHGAAAGSGSAFAVTLALMLFIAAFAVGPGVCVWLALSELMPTRIRSWGMGIGLLINQGVSTALAALFLPVTARWGYAAIFGFWAGCTLVFFVVVARWLPETKGRTLEEIEASFASRA